MQNSFYLISCILLMLHANKDFAQTPANDPHWYSSWNDNFIIDNSAIDNWSFENNTDRGGDPAVYLDDNVYIDASTGLLNIVTQKQDTICGTCTGFVNHHYTSGCIVSYGGVNNSYRDVQYGYLEVKCKIPDTYGLWPAFWTWNCDNPTCTGDYDEIDIFEILPGKWEDCYKISINNYFHTNTYMTSNIHTTEPDFNQFTSCKESALFDPTDYYKVSYIDNYSTAFHTYAIEWTPSKIIWYFDGKTIRNTSNTNDSISQVAHVILGTGLNNNVHSGSEYDNNLPNYQTYFENPNYPGPADINTNPSIMQVEYIRYDTVQCDNTIVTVDNVSDLNPLNFNSKVKKSILINGGGGILIDQSCVKFVRAQDFIEINGDFEVPIGEEIYFDVNPCN